MEYVDANIPPNETHRYQVSLVNWAGLESPKSQAIEVDDTALSKGQ